MSEVLLTKTERRWWWNRVCRGERGEGGVHNTHRRSNFTAWIYQKKKEGGNWAQKVLLAAIWRHIQCSCSCCVVWMVLNGEDPSFTSSIFSSGSSHKGHWVNDVQNFRKTWFAQHLSPQNGAKVQSAIRQRSQLTFFTETRRMWVLGKHSWQHRGRWCAVQCLEKRVVKSERTVEKFTCQKLNRRA